MSPYGVQSLAEECVLLLVKVRGSKILLEVSVSHILHVQSESKICQCTKCRAVLPGLESVVDALRIGQEALNKATSIQDTSSLSMLRRETSV